MPCPIIVIDRMNPGTPHKLLETPGVKCKSEKGRIFECILRKYNNLMVVLERNWILRGKDDTFLISFWDLRDEPRLFKEHNLIYMIPPEIVSEYELGEGISGEIYEIDIKLSREIMAVHLVIKTIHPKKRRFQPITLLYKVNTKEPSQNPDVVCFVEIVEFGENSTACLFWPKILLNEKYLIYPTDNAGKWAWKVYEQEILLSSVDGTRLAPRKVIPILNGYHALEPGMSDRLAVFNTEENRLTILDLVSTNPITIVDTIQWSILGQPSEKNHLPDEKLNITNIDVNWCCGSFLILQRLVFPTRCKTHRQSPFMLSIVDPGTVEKRPAVISQIKDIFDSNISYPRRIEVEKCYIDVMGIVYVVSDRPGKVDYLTVSCAQFHNINAAQAGRIGALEDSSSDNLSGSNTADEVVNWMGKMDQETEGKDNGEVFYSGNSLLVLIMKDY